MLRAVIEGSAAATNWINSIILDKGLLVGSELLALEVRRVALHASLFGGAPERVAIAETYLSQFALRRIDGDIMRRAATIPLRLRAADAIHVATALAWGTDVLTFVTHDAEQARAALALGFEVVDPVADDTAA